MSLIPSRRPGPVQEPPPQTPADTARPVPVRVLPSPDGVGCVYEFDYASAEPGPDHDVEVADYDASGNLVIRRRLPADQAYRYLLHPVEAEWLGWDGCTGPHAGPGRWLTGAEPDAQGDQEPPAPSPTRPAEPPPE